MFVPGLRWGNVIDHFLNDHLLNVDIKAHETDKTESLQKFLIFLICILESGAGETVILQKILDQLVNLAVLHSKNFIICIGHVLAWLTFKVFRCDGTEKLLDVCDGQNILKIINEDQHEQMIFGIALLLRGREQVILGVVIDHGLCQDLVIIVTLCGRKLILHKRGDLIHVQVDVWKIFWFYIIHSGNVIQNAF
mgnify:FL=1